MRNSAGYAVRLVEDLPFGPLWLGLLITAVMITAMVAWVWGFGLLDDRFYAIDPFRITFDGRSHLVMAVLLSFLIAIQRYQTRYTEQVLAPLQPLTRCPRSEFDGIVAAIHRVNRRFLTTAVGVNVVIGAAIIPATNDNPSEYLRWSTWDAHVVWAVATNAAVFTYIAQAGHEIAAGRRALKRISREILAVNLLDRGALAPFARFGLFRAFVLVGMSSIASLQAFGMGRIWPLLAILTLTMALATLALFGPAEIVHGRLKEAKRAELQRIRRRIHRAKESALEADDAAVGEAALLPGLIAYESRVESIPEWPFDTSTLLRFTALALLATGSWLGGAIVERMVGAVLE